MFFAEKEEKAVELIEVPTSEPQRDPRQRWKSRLAEFLKENEASINILIIILVLVDVIATAVYEFMIDEGDKDCYGRDSLPQALVSSIVLALFCAELGSRFLANGIKATLALRWNVFDFVIISLSFILQTFKILSDYLIVDAPHPPVMTVADYPLECNAFLAEGSQDEGAETARKAATGSRLLSRFAVGLRLLRAFFKVVSQRRYAAYLARSSLSDLCAAGCLEDVEARLLERPWEIGQADAFGLYAVHYAAMNEDEKAPEILEAILTTNRFAAQQRDRFGALALHYACRNRGPTQRQDTALKLHTSMEPCVHRMVRLLLNATSGYPAGAGVADMDGLLPMDYVVANPSVRLESTLRALKMLLFVYPDAAALPVHKSEMDTVVCVFVCVCVRARAGDLPSSWEANRRGNEDRDRLITLQAGHLRAIYSIVLQ